VKERDTRVDPWLLVDELPRKPGSTVALDPGESRHAAGPLRLRSGDPVVLADGSGWVASALLRSVSGRRCEAEITEVVEIEQQEAGEVILALGVLHNQAMDWAVQKAVEVGVSAVIPVLAGRSQLGAKAAVGRLEHWRRVARQALKQCRRPWQMNVSDPRSIEDLIASCGDRFGIVADPEGCLPAEIEGDLPNLLLVGPEGGLSVDELGRLDTIGWTRIRLGRHVLRADTAAVIGSSILVSFHERHE